MRTYFTYILASDDNSAVYIGVTNNIDRRMKEHRMGNPGSYTSRYKIYKLVYFEKYRYINKAIKREKQLKNWRRSWKNDLITSFNSTWKDLSRVKPGMTAPWSSPGYCHPELDSG